MMNRLMNTRVFLLAGSLLFSIMLFAYVQDSIRPSNTSSNISVSNSQTISNVPINVILNTDKYTVSGLPDSVLVRLDGSASAILLATTNNSFKVVTPDLNELGPGQHTISLSVTGLSDDLKYVVSPQTVEIFIENKETVELPVEVQVNSEQLSPSHTAGTAVATPTTVSISGSSSLVQQIDKVLVSTVIPAETRSDYTTTGKVQVLDKSGNALAVKTTPETVQVKVPISSVTKTLPITLVQSGSAGSQYSYSMSTTTTTTSVVGPQAILDELTYVPVNVDVSKITSSTTISTKIEPPAGVESVTPNVITVTISVVTSSVDSSVESSSSAVQSSQNSSSSSTAESSSASSSSQPTPEASSSSSSEEAAANESSSEPVVVNLLGNGNSN